MSQFGPMRTRLLVGVGALAVIAVAMILVLLPSNPPVVVTHWANVHMMNPALLPRFAEQFNKEGHRTRSGAPIRIDLTLLNSGVMLDELIARNGRGTALTPSLANPTIVTPAADHWLGQVNHAVGRAVVDPAQSRTIAVTWVGIVTYKEMAECLGWPRKDIGFADIVAVAQDPRGWATCPTAKSEWGQHPLLSFTDPSSSSTARAMLYALFSIAAHRQPEQLTEADVANPDVLAYVRDFNREVDHYVYDTATLNSKIYLGPRYGHFYFIAESNLVQLYQGKLAVTVGAEQKPQPLTRPMVFIYPKEGAVAHNHSITPVQASWVTPEQLEAAQQWTDYLRDDARQQAFMEEGFRPATKIPLSETIGPRFGLDPNQPTKRLNTDAVAPAAADAIVSSWGDVKKPGVAVFVADVSGSMKGNKLEESKKGLTRALDGMAPRNQVGLITFSSQIHTRVAVGPLSENRFNLAGAIDEMQVKNSTALYDAIKDGIEMADAAPGDQDAIRGVVVLTDGQANAGSNHLDDLVTMISRDEKRIESFQGMENDESGATIDGRQVAKDDIIGESLAFQTRHRIHIFFVGVGDADVNIGRILAEATGSSFQGTTEKDLAKVLEQLGKYF